jgi:hypothetical protein
MEPPRQAESLFRLERRAEELLLLSINGMRGWTALEVVAWYALLKGKEPTDQEAQASREAAVKLAIWRAVWAG